MKSHWQTEIKSTAFSHPAIEPHLAPMLVHDLLADKQP